MCERVKLPGGGIAIVCRGHGKRARLEETCVGCGLPVARYQCDWKLGAGKTCDAWVCGICRQSVGEDKDLCPAHQRTYMEWRARRASAAAPPGGTI